MTALRPRLAFRVGVTGHREHIDENDPRLIGAVDACLGFVRDEIARLAALPDAQRAYAAPTPGQPVFDFTLVSPLAEGADRLVARRAAYAGAELYAPLPFPHDAYLADFPDTAVAFDKLLKGQKRFELDGAHAGGEVQSESYEAVGRFVVRNCDLLIAIWDGNPARGQGGAESTAEYAARVGLRVWWIHAHENRPPRLLGGLAQFRDPTGAPEGRQAFADLAAYLSETILPPNARRPDREGVLGFLGGSLHALVGWDDAPLQEFYAETPRPRREVWRTYARFMNLIAPDRSGKLADPGKPGPWSGLYTTADRLSGDFGDRYRSSYVLVALFVVVALATAAFGGEPDPAWQWAFIVAEIAALAGISLLVVVNYAWRWHERWISYRLLAELARKQRLLSPIGQSLPGADVAQLTSADEADEVAKKPRDAWIAWLFMAHRRAIPPPTGTMAQAKRETLAEGLAMIDEQIDYHEGRRRRCRHADGRVRRISEAFFLGTFALAFVKLGLIEGQQYDAIHQIVFLTAAVSSLATAFIGVRAYAEFALLDRHSRHMLAVLRTARSELLALDAGPIDAPQGSLHLGRTLYATTTAMMQDITGWAHLFRVKTLEAG